MTQSARKSARSPRASLTPVATGSPIPEHLSDRAKALWREVERGYALEAT
jgi:hypothetical protein